MQTCHNLWRIIKQKSGGKVWRAIVLRVVQFTSLRWGERALETLGEQTKFHFSERDLKRRKINLTDENDSLLQ